MTLYFRDVLSFFLLAVVGALQSGNHKTSSIGNRNAKVVIPKNRRDFLRDVTATTAAVIATTTIGITPPAAGAISPIVTADTAVAAMKFRTSLPPIGLGCWAWGDSLFWGYNPSQDNDLNEVFDYVISQTSSNGDSSSSSLPSSVMFDTAELYGLGRSESLIGDFGKNISSETKDKMVIATKFAPLPFRTKPENVVKACEGSLKRLGNDRPIDLYQIHFPNVYANEEYWDGLAQAYEKGLVKNVGVSNYGVDALRACHSALAKRGIPLVSNQIQYNLLYRFPEQNGLLQACKELDVQVLSYSPMALGLLAGKYRTVGSLQQIAGPRKKIFKDTVEDPKFQNLLKIMEQISSNHGDKSNIAQVAINWCRAKGTIPIPGARNLSQVKSNYAALNWNLSSEEIALLDDAASFSYISPDAAPFPRKDKDTGLVMFDS
jgi:pyridoxine 4-dehydrogenase